MTFQVALATADDVPQLITMAQVVQADLNHRGLTQWVPAAHAPFEPSLHEKVAAATLHKVMIDDVVVAFFDFSLSASEWWQDDVGAGYVSGIVVDRSHKGEGIGEFILSWCRSIDQPAVLRLDCHADNDWLCRYYERYGFVRIGTTEQHPGYLGALYEWRRA